MSGERRPGMLNRLKVRVMGRSRQRKLAHFMSLYNGGGLLDVGVEGTDRFPESNLIIKAVRGNDALCVGLGVEELGQAARLHPDWSLVRYAGGRFPFVDGAFSWVHSNAVIEHVGDRDDQLSFINEMLRVGNRIFFTTPNRHFVFESHTNTLLLHWWPRYFFRFCAEHRPWVSPHNLRLLSRRDLSRLMRQSRATSYSIHRNRLAGMTMTFTVVAQGRRPLGAVQPNSGEAS